MIVTTVGKFARKFDVQSRVLCKFFANFGDIFLLQKECYVERAFLEDFLVMLESKCSSFEFPDVELGSVRKKHTCLHKKCVSINRKWL